ncbi:hypothetical protein K503DRAFT_804919 [Rhizopogon vinicolor AM-OR11-026]|uniref:G-protein coupled receptors family 1 profile domain-containing protein n=1 Tax=Rhizopogon vinicolor AM-OR11-026 TaxID=1314800 RepID=A0A1B7MJM4_9AGAM|nr:hypothetical protein K503DRAFT_804919 [Rhizopogon vinicolor AM-OR11-026]
MKIEINDRLVGSTNKCPSCTILSVVQNWITVIINAMMGVIIIARLYAMYQRSRKMLIFLVVTFLAIHIIDVVIAAITTMRIFGDEYVLSGAHMCAYGSRGDAKLLAEITWILSTAWETLTLCLAVWIAVKHFHELQRPSARWTVGDCFTILVKTHVFYFASFVAVSTLQLTADFSPTLEYSNSMAEGIFLGILGLARVAQMFILGPRLILAIREYHANLVAQFDEGTSMTLIAFQRPVHVSTDSGV